MATEQCNAASDVQRCDTAELSLTVGVDGRLYCHDIAPELLPLLAAMCGDDPQIAARRAAGTLLKGSEC